MQSVEPPSSERSVSRYVVAALLALIALPTASLIAYDALIEHDAQDLRREVAQIAEISIRNELASRIETRIRAIDRIARRWPADGRADLASFREEADEIRRDFDGIDAIEWIDASHRVRWIEPAEGGEAGVGVDPAAQPAVLDVLDLARRRGEPAMTHGISLGEGDAGFVVAIPILAGGHSHGSIVAVFRAQALFEVILGPALASGYAVAITDPRAAAPLFERRLDAPGDPDLAYVTEVDVLGATWRIEVAPSAAIVAAHRSLLPEVVTIAALLFSGLLGVALLQVGRTRSASRRLARANEALRRENDERRRLESQLVHTQKMEVLGRMAGGVAHDFNNQITAMLGFAEVARAHSRDPVVVDCLAHIERAADASSKLTAQLLAFSRKQVFAVESLEIDALIRAAAPMLRHLLGAGIELSLLLEADDVCVQAAPGELERVLMNLAANARDAMPDGGTLSIRTAPTTNRESGTPAVEIVVEDTGPGIPDAVRGHLFEPFFTTKEPGQGTGLGLATCYGVIRQFGGTIALLSPAGVGAAIGIELPTVASQRAPIEEKCAAAPALSPGGTVLLVDDEQQVRQLVARVLRGSGFTVIEAPEPATAFRLASDRASAIDLLLTDVVMPLESGGHLASRIREIRPGLPVLFVSGYVGEDYEEAADTASAFLQKPFTREQLLDAVAGVLDGRSGRSASSPSALV